MFELYTEPARKAVVASQQIAGRMGHGAARPSHLLLGVLTESERAAHALAELGVKKGVLRREVVRRPPSQTRKRSHLAEHSMKCCEAAVSEAARFGQRFVHSGHLLLAVSLDPEIPPLLAAASVATASVREIAVRTLHNPELTWVGGEDYIWA